MIKPVPAVITTFQYYAAGYSLMNLVRSQLRQLYRAGYETHFVTGTNFGDEAIKEYKEATVHQILPVGHLTDYRTDQLEDQHVDLVSDSAQALIKFIDDTGVNLMLTHDIVFLGWHWPYALAVQEASRERPDVKWLHWIHSVPTGFNPIWDINRYGPNHKLVFPNQTDALRVGEQFRGKIEHVVPIHHVKDIREFAQFSEASCRFIDEYDLMSADVIQIYPASVDRLHAKGVDYLIRVFGAMKTFFHKNVRLVICNQWCNVDKHRETVEKTIQTGKKYGLKPDKDLIFSSRFEVDRDPNWEVGLPEKMVAELMMLGNLFMFPTREESFGLVLPEASLMGGALIVSNASLDMMREITGGNSLAWDFGSFYRDYHNDDQDAYFKGIAQIILGKMQSESAIRHKTFMRQKYNLDYIFKHELEPAMMAMLNEAR
jgi:glycosyltransferase involved in cell wall biosynthesis